MSLIRKIIIIFAVVVFVLFIAFIVAAWYLGAFASVNISVDYRGPYNLVTDIQSITYREIERKIQHLDIVLREKGIEYENTVGILYDNPADVSLAQLRSKAGVIIKDSVSIDSILVFEKIKKRLVAIAIIKAHPSIAPFKIYPALLEWMQLKNYIATKGMRIIEHYKGDGLVEVEIVVHEE